MSTSNFDLKKTSRLVRVNGKVVGKVEGTTFIKRVAASKHFLRVPPAIAFDINSLRTAYNLGAQDVMVIDKETGKKYFAPFNKIWMDGFKVNRGFGEQYALALDKWCILEANEQLILFATAQKGA